MADVDIVISGGGVIGTAMALVCERLKYRWLLLEQPTKQHSIGRLGFDLRTLALSPQSVAWLDELHENERFPRQRVDRMYVWEQLGTSSVDFLREEVGSDSLAWIAEHSKVLTALQKKCETHDGNVEAEAITEIDIAQQCLKLSNGKTVSCNLLVVAEGANSVTRKLAGAHWVSQSLGQRAIVTVIETELTHNNTAWQRFGTGILAFLPLTNPRTHAVVWSVSHPMFEELESLDDDQFKARMTLASDRICGAVLEVDQRLSFPLNHGLADTFQPQPWMFILGDAAHTIHPLAGQGMNLGIEDVRGLESVLRASANAQVVPPTQLRTLAQRRRAKAIIMQQLMSLFDSTWRWKNPLSHWLRNLGVRTFSHVPAVKRQIIREAMGFGPMTKVN
ncbi:MAG: hypothetical protein F4227_04550 [Gammaproteobacteria bacterium]|nr:hypothetical protein [Gammaproteobacteria bacterium]MYF02242.1 hypothetical protein [Gammaproteobacteria bacterium]MYI76879.1 hypothetical protein [Gammaproteobacteria bacterium]